MRDYFSGALYPTAHRSFEGGGVASVGIVARQPEAGDASRVGGTPGIDADTAVEGGALFANHQALRRCRPVAKARCQLCSNMPGQSLVIHRRMRSTAADHDANHALLSTHPAVEHPLGESATHSFHGQFQLTLGRIMEVDRDDGFVSE